MTCTGDTSEDINARAGRERHDDANWPRRIGLRFSERRPDYAAGHERSYERAPNPSHEKIATQHLQQHDPFELSCVDFRQSNLICSEEKILRSATWREGGYSPP